MAQCPSCGSKNVTFRRETRGVDRSGSSIKWSNSYRSRSSVSSVRRATIGFCKDCGYDWTVKEDMPEGSCFGSIICFIIKWFFIIGLFPITVPILVFFSKHIKRWWIKALLILIWILIMYALGIFGVQNSEEISRLIS